MTPWESGARKVVAFADATPFCSHHKNDMICRGAAPKLVHFSSRETQPVVYQTDSENPRLYETLSAVRHLFRQGAREVGHE